MSHELPHHNPAAMLWIDPLPVQESVVERVLRFLLVMAAHAGMIAVAVTVATRPQIQQTMQELYVRLIELPPPAPPRPAPAPPPPAVRINKALQPTPVVHKPANPPEVAPILLAEAAVPALSSYTVAPPPQQRPVPESTPVAPPPAPLPVTAARFDADYLDNPRPLYPPASRRLGEEGTVLLRVQVSAAGGVLAAEVRRSSGYSRLDAAALDAVRRWRFIAARQGDTPIASWVGVPIAFRLEQ